MLASENAPGVIWHALADKQNHRLMILTPLPTLPSLAPLRIGHLNPVTFIRWIAGRLNSPRHRRAPYQGVNANESIKTDAWVKQMSGLG
jgi:hypothetical protein